MLPDMRHPGYKQAAPMAGASMRQPPQSMLQQQHRMFPGSGPGQMSAQSALMQLLRLRQQGQGQGQQLPSPLMGFSPYRR